MYKCVARWQEQAIQIINWNSKKKKPKTENPTHIKMLNLMSKQSNIKYNNNEIKFVPGTLAKVLKSNNIRFGSGNSNMTLKVN